MGKNIFLEKIKLWSDNASANEISNWEEQIRLLSEIGDLITPDLSLEEVIAVIYASVNQLMDAYQFGVGLYDEEEGTILYKGMIENNKQFPNIVVSFNDESRLAPWCIKNESDIFINDLDTEYSKYVKKIPYPTAGSLPKAALYVPLRMDNKVVAVITVRTKHKNVYRKHHLFILKTLGNFVIKSLALAQERARPSIQSGTEQKKWNWCAIEQLPIKAKKLLSILSKIISIKSRSYYVPQSAHDIFYDCWPVSCFFSEHASL